MYRKINLTVIAVMVSPLFYSMASSQALLTIEGVTLGQSKGEAIKSGFVTETYDGIEYLIKDISIASGFRRSISLRTSSSQNSTEAQRVISISVSQLFKYDASGMKLCEGAARDIERTSREALGSAVINQKARVFGSALPTHINTIYTTRFKSGSLEVESTCVAKKYDGTPIYEFDFSANL